MSVAFDPRTHVPQPAELAGRIIAITGASDGIGRAVALACAQAQAQVILIGRNERKLDAVHAAIRASGAPEATIAILDLERAVARDYDQVADALSERYGRLDGLLHNAGILGTLTPIEHYDVPTWCRVMHVNVTAAFALTQVLMPALQEIRGRLRDLHQQRRGSPGARLLGRVCGVQVRPRGPKSGAGAGARGHQPGARERAQSRAHAHRDAPPGLSRRGPADPAAAGEPDCGRT